ncbi:NAC domain protein, putative [Theobroma cacao]|uniref:NAC domain protein, putative n=1 Tax=Theobroma cacao TaxID=3641 RepID=A0A061FMQ5_THECC|nr:NAC domain protein, putative [Theobroma cacao]
MMEQGEEGDQGYQGFVLPKFTPNGQGDQGFMPPEFTSNGQGDHGDQGFVLPNFTPNGQGDQGFVLPMFNPNGQGDQGDQGFVLPRYTPNGLVITNEKEFLDTLPPGYRFKPRDEELVVHYLRKKAHNKPLPPNIIKEVELYKHSPDELTRDQNNNKSTKPVTEWYFFTPRERKYCNGLRPNRAAGDGFWKATGADTSVRFQGTIVGFKKTLVFYRGKPPKGEKTTWIMHEFVLSNPPERKRGSKDDMRLDDWVLCRLYKKHGNNTRVVTPQQDPDPDPKQEEENAIQATDYTETLEQEYWNIPPQYMLPQQTCPMPPYVVYPDSTSVLPRSMPPYNAYAADSTSVLLRSMPPYNAYSDSTSGLPSSMPPYNAYPDSPSGLPRFPESLDPMLQHQSAVFPQQAMTVYDNFIPTAAPTLSIPPHFVGHHYPLNSYQQQPFSGVRNNIKFSADDKYLLNIDFGLPNV